MAGSTSALPIEDSSDIKLDPTEEKVLKDQISFIERKTAAGAATPILYILFGIAVDYYTNFQRHTISSSVFSGGINYISLINVYFAIFMFVTTYISVATWVYTGERIARQIREQYLRAILRQNIAYFDEYSSGEVTTRITSEVHLIQDGISEKVSLTFQYIVQFIVSFIIAITISWKMTLVISYFIPFLVINSCLMNKFNTIFTKRSLDFYSRAGTIAEDVISTIKTSVAFGAQKELSNFYNSYLANARKEGYKKSLFNGFYIGIMHFGMVATRGLAYWFGSTLIINHELSPGQVTGLFLTFLYGTFSLTSFFVDIQALSLAAAAGSKIFETIDRVSSINIDSDIGDKPENVMGHIQLKNINFVYPTRPNVKTLSDISLDVEPGSIVALVGSSGSGKSTIISLILRFYDPISGGIFLDGRDIRSFNLTWLRRQISLVSQEPVLFKTSISKNMVNAHDFIMNLPDKYETMVGERGILLSGGQKQRIVIARAIIKDPKILLLDEATSALDTQNENIVQNALNKVSKNRTTIIIAHRLSTIRNATNIFVMDKGVIVESGTHKELIDKKGFYSKLVEIQQIKQHLEAEEEFNRLNPFITSLKDDDTELFTIKNEDHHALSNKSLISSRFNQKSDIEMGLEHDYQFTVWELFIKILSINKPEFLILFTGIIASIICVLAETGDTLLNDVTFWALIFLVLAVINFFAYFIQNVALGFSNEKLTERIRSMYFASILRQDISFFEEENHSVGVLTSHLSLDVTHINGLAGFRLGHILQVLATMFFCVIVSFIFGWKYTLVCLCSVPFLFGAGILHAEMISGFHQKTKIAYEYSAQIVCEGVDNIRTIAALTREDDLWKIYHHLLDEPMRQGFKNAFFSSITFAFSNSTYFLVDALTFWYGGILFINDEYDLLKIFTVHTAIMTGTSFAGRIFANAPDMAKAKSASATIISLLERVPVIDTWCQSGEKFKTVKGHIKFSDIHFHYPTRPGISVLRGLNLEVKPGQYAALVGPSGCGKSTIISLVEKFYQVTSGKITIDGLNIAKMNVNNLREHMALVSQEPSLYDMTIRENLIFGCRPEQNITQNDIEKAYSESEKVVQKALDAAARGRTTLAIAHRLSTIQHADVIFVIKDCKVHEQGTHKELLKLQGIYYIMVQEQHLGELNS
ncbi:23192_t:CDS:2 [Gigaspora rosea]|nr:23192_t:CDS:2 [Gigaspora rosea]